MFSNSIGCWFQSIKGLIMHGESEKPNHTIRKVKQADTGIIMPHLSSSTTDRMHCTRSHHHGSFPSNKYLLINQSAYRIIPNFITSQESDRTIFERYAKMMEMQWATDELDLVFDKYAVWSRMQKMPKGRDSHSSTLNRPVERFVGSWKVWSHIWNQHHACNIDVRQRPRNLKWRQWNKIAHYFMVKLGNLLRASIPAL